MLKGRRVLRSTAPSEQPKTPENIPKTEFSTLWKHSFHCVEKSRILFPLCGKIAESFSIALKTWRSVLVRIAYAMVIDAAAEAATSWLSASRAEGAG